jgi:oxygen-independent coproporphyrinogen-3 oxidase
LEFSSIAGIKHNDAMKENALKKLGLYLHIPFCIKKCLYCDFLSFEDSSTEMQNRYMKMLVNEVVLKGNLYRKDYIVDTIFIGGGTPSLIDEAFIVALMAAIKASFNVVEDAEITIESNPKTLTKNKLEAYIKSGVNRISIGAQSMDDNCLKQLGRIHTSEDFVENFNVARDSGFKNINIDLMFAIPEQSIEIWKKSLEAAISMQPEHISFYSLQIEEETPYFEMFKKGELNQTVDEVDRNMYHLGIDILKEAGYYHYEISNAAKPGYECRHNLKYWSFDDYLGIGLGSHSFINGRRSSNTKDIKSYMEKCSNDQNPEDWHHENTQKDSISEYVFTGLRKTDGIDLCEFRKRFGMPIEVYYKEQWLNINKFINDDYLIMRNDKLFLTEKGIDISNAIFVELV